MEGDKGAEMPGFLNGRQAVVWARDYSAENESRCDCETLQKALSMVPGAKRMVRPQPPLVLSSQCTWNGRKVRFTSVEY